MKKQILIIGGIIIIGVVAWFISNGGTKGSVDKEVSKVEEIESDPVDVTLVFYRAWLEAVKDPSASPYTSGLLEDSLLSADVQIQLEEAKANQGVGVDPVLCQSTTPKKVRAKASFVLDGKAEVLVLGRAEGEKSSEQAAVALEVIDGAWQVTSITCAAGETAPEREFAFDNEGFLLKGAPPQLDPKYWYLVFEQNGQAGHTVPLFFNDSSVCIAIDESESVCDSSQFINPSKARVQAGMTEEGAQVQRIQFLGS